MSQIKAGARLYRPTGIKQVSVGNAFSKGSTINANNQVDLTVPVLGFRFVLKFRITVGTAAYTSVKPEQLLGILQELRISGQNSRQKGNVTIFDMDLPSWLGFQSLIKLNPFQYEVSKAAGANVLISIYQTPVSGVGQNGTTLVAGFDGAAANFDAIIAFDVPMAPLSGGHAYKPGWALRQSEWADSIQIYAKFASLADNAENEIGVSAATTVTTLTGYLGAGSPTMDIYTLPNLAGNANDANILPGVLSRTASNYSQQLATGSNIQLVPNLQKQNTGRVFFKTGVSTLFPNFSSLSDTIISASGITVASNKQIRNLLDTFGHKTQLCETYGTEPIQGFMAFDFLNSGNPFSALAGADQNVVGPGATFQLVGNVTAVANNALLVMQEQMLYMPSGSLYGA